MHHLSDEEKFNAIAACNNRYDGIFFYGVGTTKIFCKPSCRARTPVPSNVRYFDSAQSAMEAGFRPCKKCRPDLLAYAPEEELVTKAKELIRNCMGQKADLHGWAQTLGISESHLSRLFKRVLGLTPIQYLIELRIEAAKDFLLQGDDSILSIASTVGFFSLSHFYRCFKEHTGKTPQEYRKQRGKEA